MLDHAEYGRWSQTAHDTLASARYNLEGGFLNVAVLLAEQAAQCTLKALLHGVGQGPAARGHDLLALADACEEHAALRLDEQRRDDLARLSREYQPTRYPDALPHGTPQGRYRQADARWAVASTSSVLAEVSAAWTCSPRRRPAGETSREGPRDHAGRGPRSPPRLP